MNLIKIGTRVYYKNLYELMKQTGDLVQRDGVWQPVSNPRYVYLYRQIWTANQQIEYCYINIKNIEEIPKIISTESDPNKRNFGEVVLYGELYCILSSLHNQYVDFGTVMKDALRKYIGNKVSRISHTKYVSVESDLEYYIFRVTTVDGRRGYAETN